MSTVLALRINRDQALLVADESTWHLAHVFGYRRTNYGDALANLMDPEQTARTGVAAVYAGVGFPSFHDEVVRRLRPQLAGEKGPAEGRAVAGLAHEAFLATHQRMIDDKLRFDYGFTLDELNARRYQVDGRTREIQQGCVVRAARAAASGSAQGNAYVRIRASEGMVLCRDPEGGVQCWYLGPTGLHKGFATPTAVLGDGDAVASHLMAEFLDRRHVERRRAGFTLREGLYVLMRIASEVHTRVGTMGGYLQVMLVDGDRGAREVLTDAAHLAVEVMRAHRWGYLARADAEELTAALVLDGADDGEIEQELFARAGEQAEELERYLIGFKPVNTPAAEAVDPPPEPTPSPGGRKAGRGAEAATGKKAGSARRTKGASGKRAAARKGGRR